MQSSIDEGDLTLAAFHEKAAAREWIRDLGVRDATEEQRQQDKVAHKIAHANGEVEGPREGVRLGPRAHTLSSRPPATLPKFTAAPTIVSSRINVRPLRPLRPW